MAAPSPDPIDHALAARLAARVREEQASQRLPSLVVGAARAGRLQWWSAAGSTGAPEGLPSDDTHYRIGSISKTFVAVCVLRLRDEGRLDLTDPIGRHVPELADLPGTVAHLLSHTAGLPAETPAPWWERVAGSDFSALVASSLTPAQLRWRPGRRFHYSNVGYAVLGELVRRVRGAPVFDVIGAELLEPLGMARTSVRPVAPYAAGLAVHPHAPLVLAEPEHDAGAMAPAGQLWSTIADLARWSGVLAGASEGVLSEETAAEMAEPLALADIPGQPWTGAHGLGLQIQNVDGTRRFGHAGAMPGHWAMLLVDQRSKDAIVALANSTYQGNRRELYDDLFAMLASRHQVTPFAPVEPADDAAVELLGTWYWGPVELRLSLSADGTVELRGVAPGRDCDFSPVGDGTYRGRFGYFAGERLVPVRRAGGTVSHLDLASYVLTRTPYDPSAAVPGGLDPRGWHAPGAGD
ncbi:MAG TPA: serine hydrolase domain-containing protein [Acidimicrobiales bacterium]|nr:serine hydrolase domain-containing protein [Acidimicrobiales bacterium]